MSKKLKKLKILKEIIEKNEGITIKDILKTKEIKELRGDNITYFFIKKGMKIEV